LSLGSFVGASGLWTFRFDHVRIFVVT